MKIKIEKTTTHEIEITLPAYFKWGGAIIKIISQGEYIKANFRGSITIEQMTNCGSCVELFVTQGSAVTESEYLAAINRNLEKIENILNENQ